MRCHRCCGVRHEVAVICSAPVTSSGNSGWSISAPAGLCLVLQGDWQWVAPGAEPRALAKGQGFWWAGEGGATPGQLEPLHAGADADAPALVWIALQRGAAPKV